MRAAAGLTGGVGGADTLWYHLPTAAKLTQTGSLREIEVFDAGNLTAFFPNIATFFHATGMLFLESDIASPFMNFGWAALALLAGWAIGRPLGLNSIMLLATAASLSFPGYIGHQAGSAMSDLPAFSLVLVALELLWARELRQRFRGAGIVEAERRYVLFTPFDVAWQHRVENYLGRLPLGTQHYLAGRVGASDS